MEQKKILLVNQLEKDSCVALGALEPLLAAYGHNISVLPTEKASGLKGERQDAKEALEFMRGALYVVNYTKTVYDIILSGYLNGSAEADQLLDLFWKQKRALRVVDPSFGDAGALYEGVSESFLPSIRNIASKADILIPNVTEAEYLVYGASSPGGKSLGNLIELVKGLTDLGAKNVVITGARVIKEHIVCGIDANGESFFEAYDVQPGHFAGTGDVYTALLLGEYLRGRSLRESAIRAAACVSAAMKACSDAVHPEKGFPIGQLKEYVKKRA